MSAFWVGEGPSSLHILPFPERVSLRQQVAHALRAALVAGEMRPGVLYSAPTLADKFGISPTPVREAMLDLVKEGLVEAVRNKGFRVTELSEQDLDEITAIRMLIEPPTVRDIAQNCDGRMVPKVEELRPIAREIEALAVKRDLIGYVEADRRFHLGLLTVAGNAHLVEVISNLRARSRLYGLRQLADSGQLQNSSEEHEQLVDLVLAGDAEGAARLMYQHITHVRSDWAGKSGASSAARDAGRAPA
jgi:DNA-binding GntR family transcriptional regulator